jgi:hypothetical protein
VTTSLMKKASHATLPPLGASETEVRRCIGRIFAWEFRGY